MLVAGRIKVQEAQWIVRCGAAGPTTHFFSRGGVEGKGGRKVLKGGSGYQMWAKEWEKESNKQLSRCDGDVVAGGARIDGHFDKGKVAAPARERAGKSVVI